jgi:hypothetical protein
MANKPKSPTSAFTTAEINALRATILRPPRHIFTDPIDMEHILEVDLGLGKQLTAQRLETQAELHRVMSEGSAKAAKLLK